MIAGLLPSFAALALAASPEADLVRGLLPNARAAESDLSIRADRYDAPLALEPVEESLKSPLTVPERVLDIGRGTALSAAIEEAMGRAGFRLERPRPDAEAPGSAPPVEDPSLREALRRLAGALGIEAAMVERLGADAQPEARAHARRRRRDGPGRPGG